MNSFLRFLRPIGAELVVDNFAGGGGASSGIEAALGRPVDIAINHDPAAVAMHRVNHPATRHYTESVWDIDPRQVCAGRPVGLAWFSPDCKHFSKAKGGTPVEKKIRGLAWVVLRWAATVRPRVIMLENVEEFVTWGPLVRDAAGRYFPCKRQKGRTFNCFVNALRRHGYEVEWRELRACDYGAPTIRKRLFMVARCDGAAIVWPAATHGAHASHEVRNGILQQWRTAADCIDWSIPCPSIFERKRHLAEATMRRIAKGVMRYVVETADPFIVPIANYNGSNPAHSIRNPLRTITAWPRGGHFALVTPYVAANMIRHFGESVGSPAASPVGTITAGGMGKTGLVAAHLARHFGSTVGGVMADEPLRTVTSRGKDSLVSTHLIKLRGTCADGQPVTAPMPTITAGGTHVGEVRAFLMKYYGNDQSVPLTDPLHTVTSRDRFGLVTVKGEQYRIVDIGMRMLSPRELFRAQGFPDSYVIDVDATGRRISKTQQVAKCGNAVCPPVAAELVRANMVHGAAVNGAAMQQENR